MYMADIHSPSTILPGVVASSTGGLTAQYESQGVTAKSGGRRRHTSRRQNKQRIKRRRRTKKTLPTISFMTKWMPLGK